jgi:hypothetical protein
MPLSTTRCANATRTKRLGDSAQISNASQANRIDDWQDIGCKLIGFELLHLAPKRSWGR